MIPDLLFEVGKAHQRMSRQTSFGPISLITSAIIQKEEMEQ